MRYCPLIKENCKQAQCAWYSPAEHKCIIPIIASAHNTSEDAVVREDLHEALNQEKKRLYCKECEADYGFEVRRRTSGPHYASAHCRRCGRWVKWLDAKEAAELSCYDDDLPF